MQKLPAMKHSNNIDDGDVYLAERDYSNFQPLDCAWVGIADAETA